MKKFIKKIKEGIEEKKNKKAIKELKREMQKKRMIRCTDLPSDID